jgi:cleavage and polyadenylation specificity factor subunit 1
LVILARDVKQQYVSLADFFFTNEELALVTTDEEGVMRMFDYCPSGTF